MTDLRRTILFLGLTTVGSMHDYSLLKEELGWHAGRTTWFDCVELFADLGYLGMGDDFAVQKLRMPIKKPRKSKDNPEPELTDAQKEHNKAVSKIRVKVEHAIGSMKIFNIMAHVYRSHKKNFEDLTAGICAGIHNMKINIA